MTTLSDTPGEGLDPLGYATRLLVSLMEKHYPDRHPEWKPLPDLYGVLTQIDNLSTGLVRSPSVSSDTAALPSGYEGLVMEGGRMSDCPECGMRDDDWFLCRKENCAVKSVVRHDATITRLSSELAASRERERALEREASHWNGEYLEAWAERNGLLGRAEAAEAEVKRLREAIAWAEDADPQLVEAIRRRALSEQEVG